MENKPKTYEECYEAIDSVIRKFQKKWQLKAINWFDFEDVSQTVKLHIFNKWHLWDQDRPLEPWVARVTSHQMRNIIRNNYTNYVKPCMQCKHNMGDSLCSLTRSGVQNSTCEQFAKWSKQKKAGYGIKLPLPIENHSKEIDQHADTSINFDDSIKKLNAILKTSLSEVHYTVYTMLFFENKSEEQVAQYMGYKTKEKKKLRAHQTMQTRTMKP